MARKRSPPPPPRPFRATKHGPIVQSPFGGRFRTWFVIEFQPLSEDEVQKAEWKPRARLHARLWSLCELPMWINERPFNRIEGIDPPTPPVLSSPRVIAPHKFPICPRYEKEGGKKATELSMNDRRFGEAAANKNNKTARARDHATPSQPGLLFEKLEELGEIGSFLPLDFKLRVSSVGQTKKSLQLPRRSRPILATLFRYTLSRAPGHSQPFFRLITTYFGKSFFEPPSRDLSSLPRRRFYPSRERRRRDAIEKERERGGKKKKEFFGSFARS